MSDRSDVITLPFICAECGGEFIPPDGGICSVCSKPFCSAHILRITQEKDWQPVCVNCAVLPELAKSGDRQ